MAVDFNFGTEVSNDNVAGYIIQYGILPDRGFDLNGDVGVRAVVFLNADSDSPLGHFPQLKDVNTFGLSGNGISVSLPKIEYRGEVYANHNQRAYACLEFRYKAITSDGLGNASVSCTHPPKLKNGKGRPKGTTSIGTDTGVNVVAQGHRVFSDGSAVVRIVSESSRGAKGWMPHLLKQGLAVSGEKTLQVSFSLNGTTISNENPGVEYLEFEERYGIANHCSLVPLTDIESAAAPRMRYPDVDVKFAPSTAYAVSALSNNDEDHLPASEAMLEVFTAKLTARPSGNLLPVGSQASKAEEA